METFDPPGLPTGPQASLCRGSAPSPDIGGDAGCVFHLPVTRADAGRNVRRLSKPLSPNCIQTGPEAGAAAASGLFQRDPPSKPAGASRVPLWLLFHVCSPGAPGLTPYVPAESPLTSACQTFP